jgi:hypothetical protein
VSRYKAECAPVVVPGYSKWLRALVQNRGTRPNRRRLLSPVIDVSFGQRRESRFITQPVVVQRAEYQCKNRDEFINFIVRVSNFTANDNHDPISGDKVS